MALPAWLASNWHAPRASIWMVAPLGPEAAHTAALAGATLKTTGDPDAPPLADTVKLPPWLNTGLAGEAAILVIVWLALSTLTVYARCPANPLLEVAWMEKLKMLAAFGVPEITPAGDSAVPLGKTPAETV